MIHIRDTTVMSYFTKTNKKREIYYDVGIGSTSFILLCVMPSYQGRIKIDVYYDSLLIAASPLSDVGYYYILGSVTTSAGNPKTSFITVKFEIEFENIDQAWLGLASTRLICDDNSPAPEPTYINRTRVKNNIPDPAWVTPDATNFVYVKPTPTPVGNPTTLFDPSPVYTPITNLTNWPPVVTTTLQPTTTTVVP